jgi:hypothetical protein
MNLAGDVETFLLRQMVMGMVTGLYASPAGRDNVKPGGTAFEQ